MVVWIFSVPFKQLIVGIVDIDSFQVRGHEDRERDENLKLTRVFPCVYAQLDLESLPNISAQFHSKSTHDPAIVHFNQSYIPSHRCATNLLARCMIALPVNKISHTEESVSPRVHRTGGIHGRAAGFPLKKSFYSVKCKIQKLTVF